ncbi:hypothetical protein E4U19_000987 [Claviceps sp. Clav32 group G5]|nr:hypothetical protein E4U19_000987 [Claviceps sp. Clav32 group G5]
MLAIAVGLKETKWLADVSPQRRSTASARNSRKQKAFGAVGKAFESKVTAAKAVFKKYPGSEMISPKYIIQRQGQGS